jgi:hypothetical protein
MCDLFTSESSSAASRNSPSASPAEESQIFQIVRIDIDVPASTNTPLTLGTAISASTTPLRKFYVYQQNNSGGSANVFVSVNKGTPQIIASNVPSNTVRSGTLNSPIIVNAGDIIIFSCASTGAAFIATSFTVMLSTN